MLSYEENHPAPVELSADAKSSLISLSSSLNTAHHNNVASDSSAILDVCSTEPDSGYSMVRATHGVSEGAWYFEIVIGGPNAATCVAEQQNLRSAAQLDERKRRRSREQQQKSTAENGDVGGGGTVDTVRHFEPHWRIGWSRKRASITAPVGFDKYSYSIRDSTGQVFHESRSKSYGEPFKVGDVIGCYIYIPPTAKSLEERTEKSVDAYENEAGQKCQIITHTLREEVAEGSCIQFYKNGKHYGDAFIDIWRGQYFPAASLYMGAQCQFVFGPDGLKHRPEDPNAKPIGILSDPSQHPKEPAMMQTPRKLHVNSSSGGGGNGNGSRNSRRKTQSREGISVGKMGPPRSTGIKDSRFNRMRLPIARTLSTVGEVVENVGGDGMERKKEMRTRPRKGIYQDAAGNDNNNDDDNDGDYNDELPLSKRRLIGDATTPEMPVLSQKKLPSLDQKKLLAVTMPLAPGKSSRRRTTSSHAKQIKKSIIPNITAPISASDRTAASSRQSIENSRQTLPLQPQYDKETDSSTSRRKEEQQQQQQQQQQLSFQPPGHSTNTSHQQQLYPTQMFQVSPLGYQQYPGMFHNSGGLDNFGRGQHQQQQQSNVPSPLQSAFPQYNAGGRTHPLSPQLHPAMIPNMQHHTFPQTTLAPNMGTTNNALSLGPYSQGSLQHPAQSPILQTLSPPHHFLPQHQQQQQQQNFAQPTAAGLPHDNITDSKSVVNVENKGADAPPN